MRTRIILPLLAAVIMLVGCDEIYDELGVSPEDQEEFEDFMDAVGDAADGAGGDASAGGGSGGDGSDGDGPSTDPAWSPDGVPPPPGTPTESSDYSDNSASCPAGHTCGHASYDDDGNPYDAVTSTWDDGDVEVTVSTDHHGTDLQVRSDTGVP